MKRKSKIVCRIDAKNYTMEDFLDFIGTQPKNVYIEIKTTMDEFFHSVGKFVYLKYEETPEDDEYYTLLGRVIVDSYLEEDYMIRHKVNGVYEIATIKRAE